MTTQPAGIWGRGEAYERYVGRWSRVVGREFLAWLDMPPGCRWLDVGCGTGALSGLILAVADPSEVHGIDPAEGFVAHARAHVTGGRVRFSVGDARALPFDAGSFDAVVGGLMLNFVPEPAVAVGEMARVTRPGGRVGAYVWDYGAGMEFMRRFWDAAVALDPAAASLNESIKFNTVCSPDGLATLFTGAGLGNVKTRAIEISTRFADFDDYWSPFLGGQGPGPAYVMSLDEDRRAALREHLRKTLPMDPDGVIPLTARAWAVRGDEE